jgi:hypothetical protein
MKELQEMTELNPTEDIDLGILDQPLDIGSKPVLYEEIYLKCNVFPKIYETCCKTD